MVITKHAAKPVMEKRKRVAAYARVLTGKDAMLRSLAEQVTYYRDLIRRRPDWVFAGVYADEAYTGTKEDRPESLRLPADCRVMVDMRSDTSALDAKIAAAEKEMQETVVLNSTLLREQTTA